MRGSFFILASLLLPTHGQEEGLAAQWKDHIQPLLEENCFDCHGDGVHKGELSLDPYDSIPAMQADRDVWKRIRSHLEQQLMPPPDEFQPTLEEREQLIQWIDAAVFPVDPDHPDPGRVTLRRLNRIEYENTLGDLLGKRVKVLDLLPTDDSGYGFDNIGDVLTLAPAHLEKFLEAARIALDEVIRPGEMPFPEKRVSGTEITGEGAPDSDGHLLFTNGSARAKFGRMPAGRYQLTIEAGGSSGPGGAPVMEVWLADKKVDVRTIDADRFEPRPATVEVEIDGGSDTEVRLDFTNDSYDDDPLEVENKDANLLISAVALAGPIDGPRQPKPKTHRDLLDERRDGEATEAWALRVFKKFGRGAFRRPLREGEAERYLELVRMSLNDGLDEETSIRYGLEAMLVSPSFLFREEPQPDPGNAEAIHPVDEHALASRLSYFLWSTMPDEALMQLADEGKLRENLAREIDRMIDDDRSRALVENFGGQWLQLRDLSAQFPAKRKFPNFDARLRSDMRRETQMLLSHLFHENRPLTDLLDADYTFVNSRLARHYGLPEVKGRGFKKVSLEGSHRRGILGQGSFHLLTSLPLRTSPVMRGKYVLENLLDSAPPPPPPNVPQLKPPGRHGDNLSLREQMEKHREDPACSACHALMDPIGFGLENFDADGSWRDTENGKPINSTGELLGGRKFEGADELRRILVNEHRPQLLRSVASKMLTYALGRGTDWFDRPAIDRIVRETEADHAGARSMIHAVVRSVPFQYRRGDP